MTVAADFLPALLAMAAASFACRAGGFLLMRFVRVTPAVEAALRAVPFAVMIGIVAPAMVTAGPAEWAALGAVILVMRLSGNDIVAALAGVAVVALARGLLAA